MQNPYLLIIDLQEKLYRAMNNKEEILKYDPDIILVASHYPGQKSSSHFTEDPIFKSLSCIKKKNVINISMSDLTMGPSFVSNALSIAKRVNIDK